MKENKPLREDIDYAQRYGKIPDEPIERIKYILGKRYDNPKVMEDIDKDAKKIKKIKWKTIKFTMWKVIKPSARPRYRQAGGYIHTYVPHAKENGNWFQRYAEEHNLPTIDTPCILNITIYEKTPSALNKKDTVLAEMGWIRPWRRTGDFDNYAKGIADMIQHGMLADDCLVIESTQILKYSIKPHTDIEIKYMETFPEFNNMIDTKERRSK